MTKSIFLASALAGVLLPSSAFAATTYTNRATFQAAAGAYSTETFESCGVNTVALADDQSISSVSGGPCSALTPGVTYSPTAGFDIYIAAPGQSANVTTALGVDLPSAGNMILSFLAPTTALGADFFQNFGGGSQSGSNASFFIDLVDGSGIFETLNFSVASGTGTFFGLTSSQAFTSANIRQAGGYAVIDNLDFASGTAAVPEPATWAMMILGFGLVGAGMRRRNTSVRVSFSFS